METTHGVSFRQMKFGSGISTSFIWIIILFDKAFKYVRAKLSNMSEQSFEVMFGQMLNHSV
jgi:hypothetical protein